MTQDFKTIEAKWQRVWQEQKTFQPEVKRGQPKFLCTFPYPYVNGLPHVGHLFTMMRVEAFARYQRARGKNVLFPQGWHCTGSPLVTAAKRVADGEEGQIKILKDFGVTEQEIPAFRVAKHWIDYFVPGYRSDVQSLGMSIDWRREFITTSLNPRYDAFIRWQFNKLKEKGYVALGKHPVVWCPKEQTAVSDHDRRSGEGETPQEYVLILFKLDDTDKGATAHNEEYVAIATLRPETIEGVTNIWVNPAIEYVRAKVDGQQWIVSKQCAEKLAEQEHDVSILSLVSGASIIGRQAITHQVAGQKERRVPLLPASFPTADKGTGIVMSVPSDAPDDYVALRDLQHNEKLLEQYKLHHVKDIQPIAIIDAGELGHLPAVKAVEDLKIANQKERDKLEAAKKLVYKKGFYEGVMLSGDYAGEKVEIAKEKIKEALLASGTAHKFFELTGPVVCRCLTPCIVKVVQNQWFITYSNQNWKEETHKALDAMRLYPEKARQQFKYVIDWLHDRACARSEGLGTRIPWDEQWLIESLSDSTLYNALYTFVHILNDVPQEHITDELFDFVILGKGAAKDDTWKRMHEAFSYWYPVDFRNSGKDLIQNHLTFMLFTHTALLPQDKWPQSYGVNGWVTVNGQKMSKSLGNLIPVRGMVQQYGADACRLTILNGGEGMDDPNWDTSLAQATGQRLTHMLELVKTQYHKGREQREPVDAWFESKLNTLIKKTTEAMEAANFRTALQHTWFSFSNIIKQYVRLTTNNPHKQLFSRALEAQIIMLQPFTPHMCEEAWSSMDKKTLVSLEPWPAYEEGKIDAALEASQDMIEQLAGDIRTIQNLLRKQQLTHITVIVAPAWKYDLVVALRAALQETRNPGEVLRMLAAGELKKHASELPKIVPALVHDPGRLPENDSTQSSELHVVQGAVDFLTSAFGAKITVEVAEESKQQKASAAFPGKPAIVLE